MSGCPALALGETGGGGARGRSCRSAGPGAADDAADGDSAPDDAGAASGAVARVATVLGGSATVPGADDRGGDA
ncbi:MAG TPA: hypothetical protein VIJ42_01770 [Stellaceae bacterium]